MQKQTRILATIQSSLVNPFFIDQHRRFSASFTRNRKLTFGTVVATILNLAKRGLQIVCNQLGAHTMKEPASKLAFSKARYKIAYTGFKALNTQLLEEAYQDDSEGLWREYRVFGIDGSTIRLPKSEDTVEYFCEPTDDSAKNKKFHLSLKFFGKRLIYLSSGI